MSRGTPFYHFWGKLLYQNNPHYTEGNHPINSHPPLLFYISLKAPIRHPEAPSPYTILIQQGIKNTKRIKKRNRNILPPQAPESLILRAFLIYIIWNNILCSVGPAASLALTVKACEEPAFLQQKKRTKSFDKVLLISFLFCFYVRGFDIALCPFTDKEVCPWTYSV